MFLFWLSAAALASAQTPAAASRWDEVYAQQDARLPRSPTALLKEAIRGVPRGRALDIGMGQGRNALFLARQGWTVTGIDTSAEAVRQVTDMASRRGLKRLMARQANLSGFDYGSAQWDLIVIAYVHNLRPEDTRRMVTGLRPGGRLVLEAYHADVANAGLRALNGIPKGYSALDMAHLFGSLRFKRYQELEAVAEWSNGPQGTAPLVRLIAIRAADGSSVSVR